MAAVKELIRLEADGTISFGDYELSAKTKKSDFEFEGDLYKVKTFREITRLERNEMFMYESEPGTAVFSLKETADKITFTVEGTEDAQITVQGDPETNYELFVDGEDRGSLHATLGGKLSFSISCGEKPVQVEIRKR
ncbi:MAG: endosialidase [Lachnospiraceae bacterium]|nr:endosialidase [Lachnospiraceae bacterium]